MKTKSIIAWFMMGAVVSILLGCGIPNLGQVSGTVTYDGEPLDGATVSFMPEDSTGVFAVATTDEQGRYVLAAPIKKGMIQGALAGKYRVTISKKGVKPDPDEVLFEQKKITYDELQTRMGRKGESAAETFDMIPSRYGNADSSGIQVEVIAKIQNEFNFDLVR